VEIGFDMGAEVGAFAADSGSLLRVTGRRESAAKYTSLSFEFSAATAQGPQQSRAAPYRAEFSLSRRRLRGAVPRFVKQVMQPTRCTVCTGKAIATSRRLISTPGAPWNERAQKAGAVRLTHPLMNSSKSAFTLSGSTIAMPWEPPG
jgi:hypothetical protein